MPTLHLGVVDFPYATRVPDPQRRVGVRTRKGGKPAAFTAPPSGGETTGDVATWLEEKYHVMEVFFEEAGADAIQTAIEHSAEMAIEALIMGNPSPGLTLTAQAETEIKEAFDVFITLQLADGIIPGVPTKAALKGVNHSLKHPYAKGNPERPSFKDTGTYRGAFWVGID